MKQLIQQEILNAIALYQKQHSVVNNWQQILASLAEKIILLPPQKSSWALVYRCAIAFPLARLAQLSPLLIAHKLVSLLPSRTEKTAMEEGLKVEVTIVKSGWIDFYISNFTETGLQQDYSIIIWLDQLIASISTYDSQKILYSTAKKGGKSDRLFPLQYIYGRCSSLLSLGEREGLIRLETEIFRDLRWQIKQPSPLKWSNSQGKLCLVCPQERDLLWQICLMMDYLADSKKYSLEHWEKFTRSMSEIWLNFRANCRFCGEIQQRNPSLAIARLGLIALNQWCLQAILMSQLNIIPHREV